MKKLFLGALVTLFCTFIYGQYDVTGIVTDDKNVPAEGATVSIQNTFSGDITDAKGKFKITGLDAGDYDLVVSYIGFENLVYSFTINDGNVDLSLKLEKRIYSIHPVAIEVNIQEENEGSYLDIDKEDIEDVNYGQDFPYMLRMTPSLFVSSDAGTGIGYTSMRMRGSDQTRINVTINGVPLNDSESHNVFWVNMPDFSSSIENVQIQRGVGSSTNGAASFGGSVNINTLDDSPTAFARYSGSFGSFNTIKNGVSFGSGKIGKFWSVEGRYSSIESDGFIDRGSADLESFYLSTTYADKDFSLKAIVLSGKERTYQAWWGIPESKLNGDTAALSTHIANGSYTQEQIDNLRDPDNNRTYNYYEYENQVDNYAQDHFQLLFSKRLKSGIELNAVAHYTYGRGYFEEFRNDEEYSDYGLNAPVIGADTILTTDLIRRRWLDNHFYGATFNIRKQTDKYSFIIGGAANDYDGLHFGRIIWAQNASNSDYDTQYYTSTGFKRDINAYVKWTQSFSERLTTTLDLQFRTIDYEGSGFNNDRFLIDINETYSFFNPKVQTTFDVNEKTRAYLNVGIANREPVRSDFEDALTQEVPDPEQLLDFELGFTNFSSKYLLELNFYHMMYKDQLVVTGAVNDVGAPVRTNVNKSNRTGVEFVFGYQLLNNLRWTGNINFSQNKIESFDEIIVDYTNGFDLVVNTLEDRDIAFSPYIVASNIFDYSVTDNFNVQLLTKFVGKQYLDNTSNDSRAIDPFLVNDLLAEYTFDGFKSGDFRLGIQVNNLFNEEYETFGYTYSYIFGDRVTENFFYPQAGTNFLIRATLDIYNKEQ